MYCFLFSNSIEPMCRHLRKGLEQGNLKKALVNVEWNICQDCKTDNKVKDKSEEEAEDPSVWLCLKCGHQVCSDLKKHENIGSSGWVLCKNTVWLTNASSHRSCSLVSRF